MSTIGIKAGLALPAILIAGSALGQTATVHTAPGKPVALWGISMNDEYCNYIPAPEIRIKQKPQHGQVQIVQIKLKNSSRNNSCFGTDAPSTVLVYRPNPGFVGQDSVVVAAEDYDQMGRVVERTRTFIVIVP
jgi:hypothetical protein